MDLIQDATLGLNSHLTKEKRKKKKSLYKIPGRNAAEEQSS